MRTLKLLLISLLAFTTGYCQVQPDGSIVGKQIVIRLPIGQSSQTPPTPPTCQALLWLPDDYNTTGNKRYPLYIFLHGGGESGSSNITQVTNQSLPYHIKNGFKPFSLDNNGDTVKWIVVSPHVATSTNSSYSYPHVRWMLPWLLDHYRIDTTLMGVGGLSMGGRGTWSMMRDANFAKRLAFIQPMNGVGDESESLSNFNISVQQGLGILMSSGQHDGTFTSVSNTYNNKILAAGPQPGKYFYYIVPGAAHNAAAWNPPVTRDIDWFGGKCMWDTVLGMRRVYDNTTAFADYDKEFHLPSNSVTINGEAHPKSGRTISSTVWTKVSGPSTYNIVSPNSTTTNVINLVKGYYKFRLTVTDNMGSTSVDEVVVNVLDPLPGEPENNPPVANAGSDKTVDYPNNTSTTLNGSGTDSDGSITSYHWQAISGNPANVVITSPNSATTTVTGFTVAGEYLFVLTVTDDDNDTDTDTVKVTVTSPFIADVREVVVTEYKVIFIKSDSTAHANYWVSGQGSKVIPFNGGHKFADGSGGLYEALLRKANGDIYAHNNSTPNLEFLQYDTFGLPFKAIKVLSYLRTRVAIRDDSTIWASGYNTYRWFGSNQNAVLTKWAKIPGQPAGVKFKLITKGGATGSGQLVAVASNGTVYTVNDNTTTWASKTLPGNPSHVFGSLNGFYVALINGKPYGWGQRMYLTGSTGTISTYEALADDWGINGSSVADSIIDMAVNDNTIHYITGDNKLWGFGDNAQGEVGLGWELVNRAEVYDGEQYVWNWLNATQPNYQDNAFVSSPQEITQGRSYRRVWAGNYYAFYKYAQELITGDLYSWGRNKGIVLGNGIAASNESQIPNSMDVLAPTKVQPFNYVTPAPSSFVKGTVSAGNNQAISVSSTTLTGTATPGHTNTWSYSIAGYQWTKLSGPSCIITSPNSSSTSVTGMSTGTYIFELKVTDNNTATMTDTVVVTVNAIPPRIVASASYTGGGTASLSSTINSPDGIRRIMWSVLKRPNQPKFSVFNAGSSTFAGTGAIVADSGVTRRVKHFWKSHDLLDTMYERAIGGRDTRHGLPVNASSLNTATVTNYDSSRSVTAAVRRGVDVYMVGYPSNAYGNPITVANHMTWFREIRDSAEANGVEFWVGTTQPRTDGSAPQTRFRDAADSIRANFPNNYVEHYRPLAVPNGTTIRPELAYGDNIHVNVSGHKVLANNWIGTNPFKNLAKGTAVIANEGAQNTTVSGLTQGLWKFMAAVEDTNGYVSYQVVELNVPADPTNLPPVADAGDDQIIIGTSTVLDGRFSFDPDGTIVSYSWEKVVGPADDFIAQPSSALTEVQFTNPGVYTYRLTVFDNSGVSNADLIEVSVALHQVDNYIIIRRRNRKIIKP